MDATNNSNMHAILSYIITRELAFAVSIGGIELITKMVLYVIHERLWDKINWGKK